jgi:heat shock protein HslJ
MRSKMTGTLSAALCLLGLTACGISDGAALPGAPTPGGAEPTVSSSIPGGTWRLVSIRGKGSDRVTVVDPEAFTAEFGSDGRVQLRADCNRCSASYTAGSRNLEVGLMACTRAFCTATAPTDTTFTSLVGSAQTWTVSDGGLLELASTSGALRFQR